MRSAGRSTASCTRSSPRSSPTLSFGRSPTTARTTRKCGACRSTLTSSSRSPTSGSSRRANRSDVKFSAVKPVSRVLARELAVTALLLLGVSVVVFAILYLAPGDPLNVLLEGQSPRSELALGMREALGVPRTWYGQYAAWFGYIVVYVFIHQFGMFPLISGTAAKQEHAWLYFLVPIFVLGIASGTLSEMIRHLREELSRVLAEDYIRTARAKGAPVWRHAFKEGFLIPVTEIMSAKMPFLLGGAVIVEQVFNWPGMGRMAWQAAQDRDFPVIMGIALVAAAFVRFGNLLQRVVFTAVNPRASRE